jgi:hypothetical protein
VKIDGICTYIVCKDFELLFKTTDACIEEGDFFWAPKFCFELAFNYLPKG